MDDPFFRLPTRAPVADPFVEVTKRRSRKGSRPANRVDSFSDDEPRIDAVGMTDLPRVGRIGTDILKQDAWFEAARSCWNIGEVKVHRNEWHWASCQLPDGWRHASPVWSPYTTELVDNLGNSRARIVSEGATSVYERPILQIHCRYYVGLEYNDSDLARAVAIDRVGHRRFRIGAWKVVSDAQRDVSEFDMWLDELRPGNRNPWIYWPQP